MQASDFDDVPWTDMITKDDGFEKIAYELSRQYMLTHDLDYSFVKNISVDLEYFKSLSPTPENPLRYETGSFQKEYPQEVLELYKNHRLEVAFPDYESDVISKLKKDLDIEDLYCRYQIQQPGNVVVEHVDLNRRFSTKLVEKGINKQVKVKNIKKYIVFLEDWAHGQVLMSGRHAWLGWKAGDVITFPWFMYHSSANAGVKSRALLFITGMKM